MPPARQTCDDMRWGCQMTGAVNVMHSKTHHSSRLYYPRVRAGRIAGATCPLSVATERKRSHYQIVVGTESSLPKAASSTPGRNAPSQPARQRQSVATLSIHQGYEIDTQRNPGRAS